MKVIIAGGRDFKDYLLLKEKCDLFLSCIDEVEIVSGKAKGADALGEHYAKEMGYKITYFQPDWEIHGRGAGIRRNAEMAKYADWLIAFWDGKSAGTKSMIDLAKRYKIKINVVRTASC